MIFVDSNKGSHYENEEGRIKPISEAEEALIRIKKALDDAFNDGEMEQVLEEFLEEIKRLISKYNIPCYCYIVGG